MFYFLVLFFCFFYFFGFWILDPDSALQPFLLLFLLSVSVSVLVVCSDNTVSEPSERVIGYAMLAWNEGTRACAYTYVRTHTFLVSVSQ